MLFTFGVVAVNLLKNPGELREEGMDPPVILAYEPTTPAPTSPKPVVTAKPKPDPTPVHDPEPDPTTETEEPEREIITALPVRMRIPELSLDYEIQGTEPDSEGNMQIVPALPIISWFEVSPIPGNEGNAILGGHNKWRGERSKLYTLDELDIGDEMEIEYEDGTCRWFKLESVFVYLLRTAPAHLIMDIEGEARVTLITCKPPFNTSTGTSDYRIVAIFKEENDFVFPYPPIEQFPSLEE